MKRVMISMFTACLNLLLTEAVPAQGNAAIREVKLQLSAINKKGEPITTLQRSDVRLLVNGKEQEITALLPQPDQALSLAVLIDTSNSMSPLIKAVKDAAVTLVNSVIRPGLDKAAVVTINTRPELKLNLTDDKAQLKAQIQALTVVRGSSAIYDAIAVTSDKVLSGSDAKAKRVILVLSDGQDTDSRIHYKDAVRVALQNKVAVFFMDLKTTGFFGVGPGQLATREDRFLTEIAEATGGRTLVVESFRDLDAKLEVVRRYWRSSWILRFRDAVDSGKEEPVLKIELQNPELRKQKVDLLYPRTYFR